MLLSSKARRLATYLEQNPEIDELFGEWEYPSFYHTVGDWEEFQEIISHLGGYEKSGWNGELEAVHAQRDKDGNTLFRISIGVRGACESKPKVDEDGQPVMKPVRKYQTTDTGEFEPELEWKCPEVWSK